MSDRIDIAIVTALKVEREAVVARLSNVEKLQFPTEPLTFYAGSLSLSGSDFYQIVVVQCHDMGNNDAGIAATRTIQRFDPQCVLMVGIAGGVTGKANLGDVVVSQYVHYYEFAKLKEEGRENRPQQWPSDVLLYARAQHYDESDWRGDIRENCPDSEMPNFQPDVRFGPIACGDKVVESEDELTTIRNQCPKMLAVAMEGWGVAKAVGADGSSIRYLEIRAISDQAIPGKNDDWHSYAANAAAAFTIGLLKTLPVRPIKAVEREAVSGVARPTLVVTAQSLRSISGEEVISALPLEIQKGQLDFFGLDFTDLVENKRMISPHEAAHRITAPDGDFLQTLAGYPQHRLAFHGLCSIPPVVLAGHVVSDRQSVMLFDLQPDSGDWIWPESNEVYPALVLEQQLSRRVLKAGDVIVRVSVSYPVSADEVERLEIPAVASFHLSVPTPVRGIVRSQEQTLAYGRQFRQLLDSLKTQVPNADRIHLFYAGPMALAFNVGQQVSENIHPPVIVWNFSRGYDWAIDLTKAITGEPCILRSEDMQQ